VRERERERNEVANLKPRDEIGERGFNAREREREREMRKKEKERQKHCCRIISREYTGSQRERGTNIPRAESGSVEGRGGEGRGRAEDW